MNIFQEIKALITIRGAVRNMSDVKAGWQTSEFWLIVVTNLLAVATAMQGSLNPQTAAIILAVLNGVYTVLRTIVKGGTIPPATPPTIPPAA